MKLIIVKSEILIFTVNKKGKIKYFVILILVLMPGALLELVVRIRIFLTGNPTTYFRSVYKRHTNFSTESFSNPLMVLLILVLNLKQKFLEVVIYYHL